MPGPVSRDPDERGASCAAGFERKRSLVLHGIERIGEEYEEDLAQFAFVGLYEEGGFPIAPNGMHTLHPSLEADDLDRLVQ